MYCYLFLQHYLNSTFIPPLFWIMGWEHVHILEDTDRLTSKKFTALYSPCDCVGEWDHFPKCLYTGYHVILLLSLLFFANLNSKETVSQKCLICIYLTVGEFHVFIDPLKFFFWEIYVCSLHCLFSMTLVISILIYQGRFSVYVF